MAKLVKVVLAMIGTLVVLVAVAAVALPAFLNADAFRTRIENAMTKSLGRKVSIGKLNLSILSGGLLAQNVIVADDPQFSTQPFIEANSVKIRVEVLPLLLHRDVRIVGFSLQSPKVQLLRAETGKWNYSSIGGGANRQAAADPETKATLPDLTLGHVEVEDGSVTVGVQAASGSGSSTPSRIYDQVSLDVRNFGFTQAFPFTVSAHLPGDGTVSASGTAGPINQQDASATPFSGHLELKHIDPLASGFVDASDGVSGLVEDLIVDASWSGQQMHVTRLTVDTPHLAIVRPNVPRQPKQPGANPEGTTMLSNLTVDTADVKSGTITLTTAGQSGAPAVYQQLSAQMTNITPASWSPFSLNAQLPGGGSLSAVGKAGPFNTGNNAATPLSAQITLRHVELATSGVLAPDAGISGMADLQAQVQSNGQILNASGTAHIDGIKLAKNGSPSAKPVEAEFAIAQNEQAMTGQIQHATLSVGHATVSLAGTYQSTGSTTAVNLKVDGHAVPIDDLEAFLPAVGVRLPQGSRLQGGTVTADLTVSGSTAAPVISGPVRLDNTQLAGFDLGSKLQSLSRLTGGRIGSATGSGTNVRSLSMDVREAGGGIRTDKIALDVVGVGTATGGGSVSEAGALNYSMVLKLNGLTDNSTSSSTPGNGAVGGVAGLAGALSEFIPVGNGTKGLGSLGGLAGGFLKNGIPVQIGGTTSNPTFAPNIAGLATGIGASAAQGLLSGKKKTTSPDSRVVGDSVSKALGGLIGRH